MGLVYLMVSSFLMTLASSIDTERHLRAKVTAYPLEMIPGREMLATYKDVLSSIQCTHYCLGVEGCLLFFHSPDTGLCVLCKMNLLPPTDHFLRTQKGAQFYTAVTNTCPEDDGYIYEPKLSICFKFSSEPQTWLNAADICSRERSGLFRPNTMAKITYLENLVKNSDELTSRWFHLGASDAYHEGTWVWWTGDQMDGNITNWIPGSPDNYKGEQNCMAMDPRSSHMWNDISCDSNIFYYICEKIVR